jgi:hypothetical protein
MAFRKQTSTSADEFLLLSSDLEVLENIRMDWKLHGVNRTPDAREIIDLALRRLQTDLNSGLGSEVVEEVHREMLYRQWCAQHEQGASVNPRFDILPPGKNPTI